MSQARTDFEPLVRACINATYEFHKFYAALEQRGRQATPLDLSEDDTDEQEDEVGILGAVVVAGVAIFATTAARRGEKPTEVRIEAVDSRDLVASVTASGQVQPAPRSTSPPTSPGASSGLPSRKARW